jgi:glyoxylase-like metal-dependent hydrolase (beta-lactamase superfamily II)
MAAPALDSAAPPPLEPGRPPQAVLPALWLFAPSRDSQGGSAWWLELARMDLLIDVPALTAANLAFLRQRSQRRGGGARPPWIVLTGRHGHGRCLALQRQLDWPVLVQEQEAYLLPGVAALRRFGDHHDLGDGVRLLWTPGPSPGACVLHARASSGLDGLFCGRLLVPVAPGRLAPLRTRLSFHWPRQLRSLERLRQWLPTDSPGWIATAAALGGLRGERLVLEGAKLLADLDLEGLRDAPAGPAEPR